MISAFRRYLDTWVVRAFFLVMVAAFVLWGVGDVVRLIGTSTWVAKVGGQTIEAQALQAEFQRAMGAAAQRLPQGQEPTPEMRRAIGDQTLQRMISQVALTEELRKLRIVVPDEALAATVREMPAFQGSDHKFSRPLFDTVLRNNGLTEDRFMDMMRSDIAQQQLLGAVGAGVSVPDRELEPLYRTQFERRSAEMVTIPISTAPTPPTPDEQVLKRFYDNHPDLYTTPEYRKIKVIELTPQGLEKGMTVSDAELRSAYEQHRSEYTTVAKRSIQVISVSDEAKAKALAEKWRGGADWDAMQQAAKTDGASAIAFDGATEAQFPDPELAKAAFGAEVNNITGPTKGALAWFVLKVTSATPASQTTFEQAKGSVRQHVLADKATDLMYDRANKVDDLLGNGTPFDQLPGDLGLTAVAGTLDHDGNTPTGEPAPIPGPPELKTAILAAAFQTQKGELPHLTEVRTNTAGGSAYYALTVEDITPPGRKSFDQVKQRVADDWKQDQQRHEQEKVAAAMLTAIRKGQPFADAATVAGVKPQTTPAVTRTESGNDGMPPELQQVLFGLKKGEPTMVETPEAFIVAVPADIIEPDPAADKVEYDRTREALNRSVAGDLTTVFTQAVRNRARTRINQANFDQIVQP